MSQRLAAGSPPGPGGMGLFRGPGGLRAVWGVTLFVGLMILVFVILTVVVAVAMAVTGRVPSQAALALAAAGGTTPPDLLFTSTALTLASAVGATLLMARIERRPLSSFGFDLAGAPRLFLQGMASGVVMLSLLVGLIWLCHGVSFSAPAAGAGGRLGWGLIWGVIFLMVAAFEEIAMRGYLLQTIARRRGFPWAALSTSVVFLLAHVANPGESAVGLAQVFLIGLVFAFSVWRSGSLWWAIGFHAAWDWAQSFLFGVADSGLVTPGALLAARPIGSALISGGATGPEGSCLGIPVIAATAALIWFTLARPARSDA
jgi:membrane protease YdiL (CAAX protease family)